MNVVKSLIKGVVPVAARPRLRRVLDRARFFGIQHECPVCRSRLQCFLPHAASLEPCFLCPVCLSKPPHRLAYIYFQTHLHLFRAGGRLVHIAPEPELKKQLQRWAEKYKVEYRSGSIAEAGVNYLDILNLPFDDGSVDLIYCCHVLNCLQEDRRAMEEVYRVLHPQGTALLQVPAYYGGDSTLETTSGAERIAHFQDDGIYRCYTPDGYIKRLQKIGYVVECFRAVDQPSKVVARYGLKGEVLHICRKPLRGSV